MNICGDIFMFGKRKQRPQPGNGGNGGGGNHTQEAEFPWSGEEYAPCNFALGHLRDNLLEKLKDEAGGVHCETLMCAIGAIAGFATQSAVFDRMQKKVRTSGRQISILSVPVTARPT